MIPGRGRIAAGLAILAIFPAGYAIAIANAVDGDETQQPAAENLACPDAAGFIEEEYGARTDFAGRCPDIKSLRDEAAEEKVDAERLAPACEAALKEHADEAMEACRRVLDLADSSE